MNVSDESFMLGMQQLTLMDRQDTMLDQRQLSEDLYRLSVGFLFGNIWTRPHLDLRDRQLITLAANIAMCRPQGNQAHYRSAHHIGVTHEEIMEVMIHVGMYTGWPTIANAVKQYYEVLKERGDPRVDTPVKPGL